LSDHAPATSDGLLVIRYLGLCDYEASWRAMRDFTDARDAATSDELWLLQHPAIYTLGQAGRLEHLLDAGHIPVIKVDRGGQVTYHGPGQLIAYLLLDLKRAGLGVKGLVNLLETAVIEVLAAQGLLAQARPDAPGVYVEGAKIASLGLRVRRHCSYHGLALNVDLDLEPFSRINPCGYPGLAVTRLVDLGVMTSLEKIAEELAATLAGRLGRVAISGT
jgi:lipoyl(octanoyl) transferase